MHLLKTITDVDIPAELSVVAEAGDTPEGKNQIRFASRGAIFDENNNVALLHVTNRNYYKLPGGGIEKGEDPIQAFKRECLEEIGCDVDQITELGEIVEVREKHDLNQTSYCYIAKVKGTKGKSHLEQGEIDEGFKEVWVPLHEAIRLLKESRPTSYNGPFIILRDLAVLEKVKSMCQS